MSRYDALTQRLRGNDEAEVLFTFDEIDDLIGGFLNPQENIVHGGQITQKASLIRNIGLKLVDGHYQI